MGLPRLTLTVCLFTYLTLFHLWALASGVLSLDVRIPKYPSPRDFVF